ncbi:sulfotransferase [Pseudotabrizicola sp. 4114]|uniref:sulfotransferase n=1 Tax=Pseudotabrizicola sp. 4114 TaxID=2817731 RepID=UPI0028578A4C|nr:hypothetical protein [Pseudorhodobacter sp. 4114]
MKPRPLLILGMHRSGTSCLTGQLEEAGVWLGEVHRSSVHNAKGNRENPEIMALNEAVLVDNGSRWNQPPDGPVHWATARLAERDRILAAYPSDRVWGFKDPRTLFTLDAWRDALPDARFVGTIRHPLAVARSLNARSRMPVEMGFALWTRYNARLLRIAQREECPILSFDVPAPHYIAATVRLIESLGLAFPSTNQVFFDESLRHQAADSDIELPRDVATLYAALCERVAP